MQYGRIFADIWNDPDFVVLPAAAQRLYMLLLSQRDLTQAGSVPLALRRWAGKASDTSPESVRATVTLLESTRFVVVDWDVEELLVRSRVRRDEVWKQPNMFEKACRQAAELESASLRAAFVAELRRLPAEEMTGRCRQVLEEAVAALSASIPEEADIPSAMGNGMGTGIPTGMGTAGLTARDATGNDDGPPEHSAETFLDGVKPQVNDHDGNTPDIPSGMGTEMGTGMGTGGVTVRDMVKGVVTLSDNSSSPKPLTQSPKHVADQPDPPRPDIDALCAHLADRIEGNGSKRPGVTDAWRTDARLMLDRDKRDAAECHRLIDWCQDSPFWRPNIMSVRKFREKFDTLRLQAGRDSSSREVPSWRAGTEIRV